MNGAHGKIFPVILVGVTQYVYWVFMYLMLVRNFMLAGDPNARPNILTHGVISNLQAYALSMILFALTCAVIWYMWDKINENNKNIQVIFGLITLALGIQIIVGNYFLEINRVGKFPSEYIRHQIHPMLYATILIFFTCICIFWVRVSSKISRKASFRVVFAFFVALLQAYLLYSYSPFSDIFGYVDHIDAYTTSILTTLSYEPFGMHSVSIYGHYGLFFLLPIKILQAMGVNEWQALTLCLSVIGFITFIVQYKILDKYVKNNALFTIGVLACAVVSFQLFRIGQYYQLLPHRLVFPALMLLVAIKAFECDSNLNKYKILGHILATLAVVWNTETGVVCVVAWTMACMLIDNKSIGKWNIKIVTKALFVVILTCVMAYTIVNLYNLVVGGNLISIKTFIYPIGSDNYDVSKLLQLPLLPPAQIWFMIILTMFGSVAYLLPNIIKTDFSSRQFAILISATLGLGVFTYYMNRVVPGSNDSIAYFFFVFILTIVCDIYYENRQRKSPIELFYARTITPLIAIITLCSFALGSISHAGIAVQYRIHSYNLQQEELRNIQSKLPQDAVAFGCTVPQLFALLGRKPGIYMADWIDTRLSKDQIVNPIAVEYLKNKLKNNDYKHILVNVREKDYIPETDYALKETFTYLKEINKERSIFLLYERKKERRETHS